jgi:hypothetical protein
MAVENARVYGEDYVPWRVRGAMVKCFIPDEAVCKAMIGQAA